MTEKNVNKAFRPLARQRKAKAKLAVAARMAKVHDDTAASIKIRANSKIPKPIDVLSEISLPHPKANFCRFELYEILNVLPGLIKNQILPVFHDYPSVKGLKTIVSVFINVLELTAKQAGCKRVSKLFARKLYYEYEWYLPFEIFWQARKKIQNFNKYTNRFKNTKEIELDSTTNVEWKVYKCPYGKSTPVRIPKNSKYIATRSERRFIRKQVIKSFYGKNFNEKEYKKLFLVQNRNEGLDLAIGAAFNACPNSFVDDYYASKQLFRAHRKKVCTSKKPCKSRPYAWGFLRRQMEERAITYSAIRDCIDYGNDTSLRRMEQRQNPLLNFENLLSYYYENSVE